MNYKSIISNLNEASEKVQNWEAQGFVPSIEKDSVLSTIRKIYDELTGGIYGTISEESKLDCCNQSASGNFSGIFNDIQNSIRTSSAEAIECINSKIDECQTIISSKIENVQSKDGFEVEGVKEFIKASQAELLGSFDISNIQNSINEIKNCNAELISFVKEAVNKISFEQPVAEPENSQNIEPADKKEAETEATANPASNIKVDIKPPVLGFYSIPENLRIKIINDLFDNDITKAEISVNKMCSLKTIEEILIYIEEHFSWNPENATAVEFINFMSKHF